MRPLLKSNHALITVNDRIQLLLLWLIRISLIAAIGWGIAQGDWENAGMSFIALFSTYLPLLLERHYRVILPIEFHLIIVIFLYSSLFLGEVGNAYKRFWWWDIVLHTSSGVVIGFVGLLTLYVLHLQRRLRMSYKLMAFFSFCLSLAAGAIWEIIEFSFDVFFGTTMQKGNSDTMHDLVVDALGALIIATMGYFYLKKVHKKSLFARFVDNFIQLNPQLARPAKTATITSSKRRRRPSARP